MSLYIDKTTSGQAENSGRELEISDPHSAHRSRERRLALLIRWLPNRLQNGFHWLRQPSRRWVRVPAGTLLIAGGMLSILPVFGLWMLPVGVVLLAEDVPPLRRPIDRALAWIELRRPHWMGLPRPGRQT